MAWRSWVSKEWYFLGLGVVEEDDDVLLLFLQIPRRWRIAVICESYSVGISLDGFLLPFFEGDFL